MAVRIYGSDGTVRELVPEATPLQFPKSCFNNDPRMREVTERLLESSAKLKAALDRRDEITRILKDRSALGRVLQEE